MTLPDSSPSVLLATCRRLPEGEPGGAALTAALAERGIASRWASWDDETVDWSAADLVVVRSTWDYSERRDAFLRWSAAISPRLVHGEPVFAWNTHKGYLIDLRAAGVSTVPTEIAASSDAVRDLVSRDGDWVVKPAVGAGGRGVARIREGETTGSAGLVGSSVRLWSGPGPWVVQPYLPSVTGVGEVSVFVVDGAPVAQVAKRPAREEFRVHETYGGTSRPVRLTADATTPALTAWAAAQRLLSVDLVYARVDLLELDGAWVVSEVELTEPGLYLDVLPQNAAPFADAVARRLAEPSRV